MSNYLDLMKSRDLVAQVTHEDELREHLETPQTAYCGFDPTAVSLHIGHLIPVMLLARWQRCGHRAIALMGGGTAMIGDPTGKTSMRQMLTLEDIERNIENFKKQVSSILDVKDSKKGIVVNNADWLRPLEYLPFLRDIGSQFSVNKMLTAECFKTRLETGLSFLEFNYMLLQSYDFLHLNKEFNCTLQLGGDDQWSNMLSGVDLVRRLRRSRSYCLTVPLFQTSDGKKMGKTEKGAVWIDPNLTPPYDYFQFWRNIPDSLVGQCLRMFTFMDMSDIRELEKLEGNQINDAKIELAVQATSIVHGEEEAQKAKSAASKLFGGGGSSEEAEGPTVDLEAALIGASINIVDLLLLAEVVPSKSEARRLVQQGGIFINGTKVLDIKEEVTKDAFLPGTGLLLKKGKKHYYHLRISN